MLDGPATYPMLRGRRRRGAWRFRPGRRAVRIALLMVGAAGLLALVLLLARRADAPDPANEVRISAAQLARGNYSAARNHALLAAGAAPGSAAANLALARAYLALGDGGAAEGAVTRAVTAGLDPARAHVLLAEARLLQGDEDRARAEVARAAPADAAAALRIRARALSAGGDPLGAARLLTGYLAGTPGDGAAWIDLARIRGAAGDVAGAGEAAVRAVRLAPASPDAYLVRGQVVRGQYGLIAALPWFEAALARDAYYHDALIDYAATLGEAGRYTDMLEATRRALAARPGSAQALYLQGVLAARAGRMDLARAMIARTAGALDALPGMLLLAGGLDYADGRYQQAATRWGELVARQPMNVTARRLLGAAMLKAGDTRTALDLLRPVALRDDADSYTLTLVGRAFEATGERDWAARFLDRAAQAPAGAAGAFRSDDSVPVLAGEAAQAPGDPVATVALIRGLLDDGDTASALARASRVAGMAPGSPESQVLTGDVLAAAGRIPAAARAYRAAAGLRFDTPTMLRLVDAFARSGNRAGASNALALYLAQNPESLDARRVAASLQLATQDWEAGIATLEGLIVGTGARDVGVLTDLAIAYAGAGDGETARRYARAAYRIQPMSARVSDAYGWALYQADEYAAAVQLLSKAARLAPASGAVRWHLAQALADANRDAEARVAIAAALRDPRFAERAAARALLAAL